MVLNKSKIRDYVKSLDLKTSGDFYIGLELKVKDLIEDSADRATSNGRSTVMVKDL